MKPYKYTTKGSSVIYHYHYEELKEFLRLGKEQGNVGWILTKRIGMLFTYRGFGTIDNPVKHLITISFIHDNKLDGEFISDDLIVNPVIKSKDLCSYKYKILKF